MKVVFGKKAEAKLNIILGYIVVEGYPETAIRFIEKFRNFGESLSLFPEKYPICRFPELAEKKYRCAVFEKNYIFVYKELEQEIVIFDIFHVKRLK
ncbi:MAG: hypothetical protein QG635_933 [Bacteroidota bacterium]|nr:hypothetical protein [Bacteroidota bacterium]